jgi:hypothetical protein
VGSWVPEMGAGQRDLRSTRRLRGSAALGAS